jgi:hypothetical protein
MEIPIISGVLTRVNMAIDIFRDDSFIIGIDESTMRELLTLP